MDEVKPNLEKGFEASNQNRDGFNFMGDTMSVWSLELGRGSREGWKGRFGLLFEER